MKKIWVLSLLLILVYATGCSLTQKEFYEMNIFEEKNHLEIWKDNLPHDTTFQVIDEDSVLGLIIEKDGKEVFAVSYEPQEYKNSFDYWRVSIPYKSLPVANTEELYRLFAKIAQLETDEKAADNISDTGLEGSETAIFIVYAVKENIVTGKFMEPIRCRRLLIGSEDGNGNYYAAYENTDHIFCITKDDVDAVIELDPYQYILNIPTLVSAESISRLHIFSESKNYTMIREEQQWKLNGRAVTKAQFQSYYQALQGITIMGEVETEDTADIENRSAAVTLQFIRDNKAAPDVEICYYEYNDERMIVAVNEEIYFWAERDNVLQLQETIKAAAHD